MLLLFIVIFLWFLLLISVVFFNYMQLFSPLLFSSSLCCIRSWLEKVVQEVESLDCLTLMKTHMLLKRLPFYEACCLNLSAPYPSYYISKVTPDTETVFHDVFIWHNDQQIILSVHKRILWHYDVMPSKYRCDWWSEWEVSQVCLRSLVSQVIVDGSQQNVTVDFTCLKCKAVRFLC